MNNSIKLLERKMQVEVRNMKPFKTLIRKPIKICLRIIDIEI